MQNKDEDDVKGKEKGRASIIGESRGEKIHTKNGTFQQLPFDERFVYHHLRADLCDFLDRDSVNTVLLAVARSWKTPIMLHANRKSMVSSHGKRHSLRR